MRSSAALLLLVSVLPNLARADVPGPHDELCTVEVQQRDGSHCEACSVSIQDRSGGANPCAALEARGLHRRCSIGATHSTTIYCDSEADWIEVGDGGGCGCRATGGRTASWAWPLGALLAVLRRRRSAAVSGTRRGRGRPGGPREARARP